MDGIIRYTYSRLTLYDLLAMLLPGILFVGEILYLLDIPLENKISVSLIVLLAYPAGLVLHSLSECVWNNWLYLRNKPEHIRISLNELLQNENTYMLKRLVEIDNALQLNTDDVTDNQLLDKYNKAYYYVVDVKQHGNTVRTLEGQIAMMRNMVIPFIALMFVIYKYYYHIETFACWFKENYLFRIPTLFLLILGIFVIVVFCGSAKRKQKAIYHRVWEDYEYLQRMEANYEKTK